MNATVLMALGVLLGVMSVALAQEMARAKKRAASLVPVRIRAERRHDMRG